MVAKPALLQNSWGSGALAVDLEARFDVKAWYRGCRQMVNLEPVPQGGFRLMARSRFLGRGRRKMAAVAKTLDVSNNGPSDVSFVARSWNFPTQSVSVAVVKGFKATPSGANLFVEYRDPAGAWLPLGASQFEMTTELRDRVSAQPPGERVTADGLRYRIAGMSEAITVAFDDGAQSLYAEKTPPGDFQKTVLKAFKFGVDEGYVFAYTIGPPAMVDIWRQGAHVGAQLTDFSTIKRQREMKIAQQFDTLLGFHRDVESERIMRRGADWEWAKDTVPWEGIPKIDLGRTAPPYPKTDDVWEIWTRKLDALVIVALNVIVDGEETGGIEWDSGAETLAEFAAEVQAAILALPSMKPDVTVAGTQIDGNRQTKLEVTFSGENAGKRFQLVAQVVNSADAASFAVHSAIGKTDYEEVFSSTRGWAGAACFFQDRLTVAGFKAKPAGVSPSRVGEYYDLNTEAIAPSSAAFYNIGNTGAETVLQLFPGRHLLVFTDSALYFVSTQFLDKTQPVNFTFSGNIASHPEALVQEIDDEVFYLSTDGELLYACRYDDVSTRYLSEPVSLLASQLVTLARETARQRASSKNDASRLYLGRTDGRLVVGHIIREQEIFGFSEWATAGLVDSVVVNDAEDRVYLAVTRDVDGYDEVTIEWIERDLLFDCAVTRTKATASVVVDGLDIHEGHQVWAEADGYVVGPYTVAGGKITLDAAANVAVVGRWTPPVMETLPLIDFKNVTPPVVVLTPGRIHTVNAYVLDTTSIAIGANGRRARDVALYRYGMPADQPPPGVSAQLTVNSIRGFSDEPTAVITQTRPGRLTVRDIALEASL